MDEHALGQAPELEAVRERHLRQLLERLEAGTLEPYEYTLRVAAVEGATTVAQIAAVADAPAASEGALDPVDLALLARRTPPRRTSGPHRSRLWWLLATATFFVALLLLGLWLVSRATALHGTGGLRTVPAATVQGLSPPSPSSVRSPRR